MTSETRLPRNAEKYDPLHSLNSSGPLLIMILQKDFANNFDASGGSPNFNNGMLGVGVKSS